MHETAIRIVSLFRDKGSEISTSKILEEISGKYKTLRDKASEKEDVDAKREIAQLHRRVLHHLNKLVDMGILNITKHGEKGEKFFSSKIAENEELIEMAPGYKKRIIASRAPVPSVPIEGYEQKGMVVKYEPSTWIERLNSVIVFSNNVKDFDSAYNILIGEAFPIINDAAALENFESLLNAEDACVFLEKLNAAAEEYGKIVSIVIELGKLNNEENLKKLLGILYKNKLNRLKFIFSIEPKDIEEKQDIFSSIVRTFLDNKMEMFIKNNKMQRAPYFVGRAGPYCLSEREVQVMEDLNKETMIGCGQSSVIVDVNKFYRENGLDAVKFSQLMLNISKSMLSANSIQRRMSGECFGSASKVNNQDESRFLLLSRNYIRLWNFGLSQPEIEPELVINMINEAKKKLDNFAEIEEEIYKSCGMTTRFRIALSPAFENVVSLSEAKYAHMEIRDLNELHERKFRKRLANREEACELFEGGNIVTFHYQGILNPDKIARQMAAILINYKLPLFAYDFSKMKGELSLEHFINQHGDNRKKSA